jgi:hypothetical protein
MEEVCKLTISLRYLNNESEPFNGFKFAGVRDTRIIFCIVGVDLHCKTKEEFAETEGQLDNS